MVWYRPSSYTCTYTAGCANLHQLGPLVLLDVAEVGVTGQLDRCAEALQKVRRGGTALDYKGTHVLCVCVCACVRVCVGLSVCLCGWVGVGVCVGVCVVPVCVVPVCVCCACVCLHVSDGTSTHCT